jgi:flagellar basal body-associated protein FliL
MRRLALLLTAILLSSPAFAAGGGHGEAAPPKKEHQRKITSSPAWVSVDPITIAVMRQNRITGVFLIEFGLDITDEKLRGKADVTLPRLRDAWLRAMSDFASTRVKVGRQADLDALTSRLQGTTDQMLGASGAKVLLLQAVVRER